MTGCLAIQQKYGDAVLEAQLKGARSTPNGMASRSTNMSSTASSRRIAQARPQSLKFKHPAHRLHR